LGMADMDDGRVIMWNSLFFLANVIKSAEMTESMPVLQRPLLATLVTETCVCLLVCVFSYFFQVWVTECSSTAFEISASRIDKTMTDHLLSAFCDVQVKLGSNLQVVGPHEKLSRILSVRSPAENEFLNATSFLDYMASTDQARFKAFIEASSAPSDQCTPGHLLFATNHDEDLYKRPKCLPSALHVHLRDSSGRHIPASIFHSAAMIADGESHHLIGICVDSFEEFTERQQSSESSEHPEQESAEQANQNLQAGQASHAQSPSRKSSSSLSSGSSSPSSRSKRSARLLDLPMIKSMSVTFNPFEWSLKKISWNLSESGDKVLAVDDCMLQPGSQEFRNWVQTQVSVALFQENETLDEECQSPVYGSLTLTLPQMHRGQKQIVLSVKSAWLDFEDLNDIDDEEDGVVSLQLEGVQQIVDAGQVKEVMATISE